MRQKRVLIADDDHDCAQMLSELVQHLGHEVAVADSGRDALLTAKMFNPEVAILDLDMPLMDGFEAACALRNRDRGTLIVAVTGLPPALLPQNMMTTCFDRHFTKPVSMDDLRSVLEADPA